MTVNQSVLTSTNSKVCKAKSYLMHIETILLDIKITNLKSQTASIELISSIKSIETFLIKAKEILE